MRYRQIHLDFHTSPIIPDVGADFDVDDFVQTLKDAHVNSINIFAKCHHGMCYYPTKVGIMHPSLKFDLLGTMISRLHENDINCPVYFPLGWEEDAANHADWLELGADGVRGHKLPNEAGYYTWRKLCLNNPDYRKHIKAQLSELMDNYDIDGFWFDIIHQQNCICPTCMKELKEMGYKNDIPKSDIASQERNARILKEHDDWVLIKLQDDLNTFIREYSQSTSIETVYNTGWIPDGGYDTHAIEVRSRKQGHIELESLPSGEWGYSHFPLLVNFHNRHNAPVVGMNGKFHLSWGDHGSLKNQEALEFECFRMIANGCMACVGDQLHPRGNMNRSAYRRIGKVYEEIEKLEPYLEASVKCAEIGVVCSTDFFEKDTISDEGVLHMLNELHYNFNFITVNDDLSQYKLLILPDSVNIRENFNSKISSYLAKGGHVLATYRSCCPALHTTFISDNAYTPSYILINGEVNEKLGADIDPLEYVCYETGAYIETDLDIIAQIGDPYFNRTAECFSSHRHFPFNKESKWPAIAFGGGIAYCAFPLFKDYIINGNRVYRDIVAALINKLLPSPMLKIEAPTSVEVTLRKQVDASRTIIHILSYIPERRTKTIDVVDTKIPLYNVKVKVRLDTIQNDGFSYAKENPPAVAAYQDGNINDYNDSLQDGDINDYNDSLQDGDINDSNDSFQKGDSRYKVLLSRSMINLDFEISPDGYLYFTIPCIDGYEVVVIEPVQAEAL